MKAIKDNTLLENKNKINSENSIEEEKFNSIFIDTFGKEALTDFNIKDYLNLKNKNSNKENEEKDFNDTNKYLSESDPVDIIYYEEDNILKKKTLNAIPKNIDEIELDQFYINKRQNNFFDIIKTLFKAKKKIE